MTDEAIIEGQRRLWGLGDYPAVAKHLLPISVDLVEAVGVVAGQHVLDVATGDGNSAILVAGRGATVSAIDLSPVQVERARARLQQAGIEADVCEGNAEDLPYADATFDAALSCMGVIFAPDHERVLAELVRVCRPGSTVGLTAWSEGGWSVRLWDSLADVLPPRPSGGPTSEDWGDEARATARFAAAGMEATCVLRPFSWDFPTVADAVELFTHAAGPFVALMELAVALDVEEVVRARLVAAMEAGNVATDGTLQLPAPYLLVTAATPT